MANTLVSPVISNTLRMRLWVHTSERSPSWAAESLEPADEHTEAGGVEEVDALEVDDDAVLALADQLDQTLSEAGCGVHIDFPVTASTA